MNSLDISLDKNSYQVLIKQNIFKSIGDYLTNLNDYNKVFVITQKLITNIYHPHFLSSENNILFIEDNESGNGVFAPYGSEEQKTHAANNRDATKTDRRFEFSLPGATFKNNIIQ